MRICKPEISEYPEIQRFLEDVYGHAFNYFPLAYPQVWKKENADFSNIFVLKERGEIVSLVRIFPLETVQNGIDVNLGGIGAVSTAYSRRGKGYMSKLLLHAFEEMEKQKFPLSVLGGDRHRYGNFGYENGGAVIELAISSRGFRRGDIKPVSVKRYAGEKDVLAEMAKVYAKLNFRKKRSLKEFGEIYTKPGIAVYHSGQGKKFAFAALSATEVRDGNKQILEFAGNNEIIPGIMKHLSERFGFPGFSLSFPDFREIPDNIMYAASGWSFSPCLMIKVMNLRQTIEIFSKQKGFFFPEGEELTLAIENKESVVIRKKKGVVYILNGSGMNEVVLSETGMVRLLFGTSFRAPAGIREDVSRILRQFLPFNLFLGRLDYI